MEPLITCFLIGVFASFLGTLPFGPINLAVIKTTVDQHARAGLEFAIAASLIEILQAVLALWFGAFISSFWQANPAFEMLLASVFILLGAAFWLRRPAIPTESGKASRGSPFAGGLLIALLNPQAVPYWILATSVISQSLGDEFLDSALAMFLSGVALGKFAALCGFVMASHLLKARLQQSGLAINRLVGIVLLAIGILQWIRLTWL